MSREIGQRRVTQQQIVAKKRQGEKIVSLTAYDYTTAKLLDETDIVDCILVGDSLGMVCLGYSDTLSVTMEDMLHHVKAVSRGVSRAMVVADMPFMSVHVDFPSSVRNAGRMMQEGRADAVKVEGASQLTISLIEHLTKIGIPVMAHLGFTPQSVQTLGGFKVQAKTMDAVKELVINARKIEEAGAFSLVLEMVPVEVAALITGALAIPTIGIGAGPVCDGQILVIDDFTGKFTDFKPRFVRTYMDMASLLKDAVKRYSVDILSSDFPDSKKEAFHFPSEYLDELRVFESALALSGGEPLHETC